MMITEQVVVVTGAARGIGKALAQAFITAGAAKVFVVDMDQQAVQQTAQEIGGIALTADVSQESQVRDLIAHIEQKHGPIGIYCSNAGQLGPFGFLDVTAAQWQNLWQVNVMAHVHAAKHCLPHMLERGAGHLMFTASAAGLLTQLGTAPYSVTKHAAVGLAEWIRITYGEQGIGVSCLCPQGVNTAMITGHPGAAGVDGLIEPEDCAQAVLAAIQDGSFLITPHPQVREYIKRKADDPERWLRGMQRLQTKLDAETDQQS